jgi:hypothetical protein
MSRISEEHYVNRIDEFAIVAEDLSEDEKAFLFNLNNKLIDVEVAIKNEVTKLIKIANSKVSDTKDWVDDYEIKCYITFILDENDPDYKEDDDNILHQLWEHCPHQDWHWGLGDNNNHNEFQHWDHPMKNEHHCWLYYSLYDQSDLGWSNILRIGSIWLDVNIEYQKVIELKH